MSHFTVLVAANSLEELEAKLQPYHEYECTGIKDQYVVFVEADMEEALKEWGEQEADYDSFDSFMNDWYGYEQLQHRTNYKDDAGDRITLNTHKWGRHTNPNKRWDWWVIGGRWPDILLCKDGSKGDFALNKHIDWAGMKAKVEASAPITFAFINQAGEWHERAEMGWFGTTTNHSDSAGQQFWDFVESLSPDQGLYVVDCHI